MVSPELQAVLERRVSVLSDKLMANLSLSSWRHRGAKIGDLPTELQTMVQGCMDSFTEQEGWKGIFLSGRVGAGKTHALYAIVRLFIQRLVTRQLRASGIVLEDDNPSTEDNIFMSLRLNIADRIQIVTHFEFIRQLREAAATERGIYGLFPQSILMIDDLGRGHDDKSGWNLSLQDEFFDLRWKAGNEPVFITTNLTPDELRSWPGWTRIIDRLCDPAWNETYVFGDDVKSHRRN